MRAEDTVVITATRTEQALSEVGQTISVLDAEEIHRRQSDTVVDLLRNLPGVTFARNGGVGTTTSVFIRGAENEHAQVLKFLDLVEATALQHAVSRAHFAATG